MRTWKLTEPKTPTYRNPKKIIKLEFTDRLNTSYIVSDTPIESLELGVQKTYKDYLLAGLDPNIDQNKNVYGIAKKLGPLTTRINEMKNSIDGAGAALSKLKQQVVEEMKKTNETTEQPAAPAPAPQPTTNTPNGGN